MRKWSWLGGLLLAALLPLRALAIAITSAGAEERLIVQFKSQVSALDQKVLVQAEGLQVLREIPALHLVLVKAPKGQTAVALSKLSGNPNISQVVRDVWRNWLLTPPASLQETPLPSVESVMSRLPKFTATSRAGKLDEEAQWGVKRVNAPAAWPSNQGAEVKVAIIDTGIDPNHPELKGHIAGGYNAIDKEASWADDHFHGTHVAGIVAATLDGKGVVGVAPKATLYAVKVLSKEGKGSLFTILDGIIWAAQNGIQVINMSLGAAQKMPLIQEALQMAQSAGVTIVCAAGNGDGKGGSAPVGYPAAFPECIAVSALDKSDGITKWSSRGPEVGFIAPGLQVPSTVPYSHDPSGVKAYSGTSMATPHVAGLAALAIAAGASGPQAVRAALERASEKLPNLSANEQGKGLINAANFGR